MFYVIITGKCCSNSDSETLFREMIFEFYNEYAVYIRVKPSFDTSIEWSHQRALELNMIRTVQWETLGYQPML